MFLIRAALLKATSQTLVGYINLLIRKCYTTTHRGVDIKIDESIRYLTLKNVYGLSLEKMDLELYDEKIISEIEKKIDIETQKKINQLKIRYKTIITAAAALAIVPDDKISIKRMLKPLSTFSLLYYRNELRFKFYKAFKYFRDANRVKVTLPINKIGQLIGMISPVIIIEAIIRQYFLSKSFGYNMDLVLGMSDYISASITAIINALLPLCGAFLLGFWATLSDLSNDPVSTKVAAKKSKRDIIIVIILFSIIMPISYFVDRDVFRAFIEVYIILFAIIIVSNICTKYIVNFFSAYTLISFLLIFSVNMYSSTMNYIDDIRNGKEKKYEISGQFEPENKENLRLVVYGSKYIVFWDKLSGQTFLIKPELVDRIIYN